MKIQELTDNDFLNFKYGDGEMLPYERYKLYQWVKECSPNIILEVGTGTGASTFYLAHAQQETNPNGKIFTCDPVSRYVNGLEAFKNINFNQITSSEMKAQLISSNLIPDFIFFDGPEIEDLAFNDLKILEPHLKLGTKFAMHDWENVTRTYDGSYSIKSLKIRPYIETSPKWKAVEILSGLKINSNKFSPWRNADSVGLCLYEFCDTGNSKV